jgi:hypothetical protein
MPSSHGTVLLRDLKEKTAIQKSCGRWEALETSEV